MDAIEGTSYWAGAYLEWLDAIEQQRLEGRIAEALGQAGRLLHDEREALESVASELQALEGRIVALRESALSARAA